VIRLIVAVGNDHAGTREDSGVRRIRDGDHARWHFALQLVLRIAPNQKHGAQSEALGSIRALLEEISGSANRSRAQGQDDGRFAGIDLPSPSRLP
jgi:hypothetical protein